MHMHVCSHARVQSVADGGCAGMCVCVHGASKQQRKRDNKDKIHQKERQYRYLFEPTIYLLLVPYPTGDALIGANVVLQFILFISQSFCNY